MFNGAFPVLPGNEDAARNFAKEVMGPRRDQFAANEARSDVNRETWSLLTTPDCSFVNVWFRQQVLDLTGVDMPAPDGSIPSEVIFDWKA